MEWIKCSDELPKKDGRYFTLTEFLESCIVNGSIVRKYIPMTSNFYKKKWMNKMDYFEITHWMEIPELPKD